MITTTGHTPTKGDPSPRGLNVATLTHLTTVAITNATRCGKMDSNCSKISNTPTTATSRGGGFAT